MAEPEPLTLEPEGPAEIPAEKLREMYATQWAALEAEGYTEDEIADFLRSKAQ